MSSDSRLKILHVSDTHGTFPELVGLDEVDLIVHSGDFAPSFHPNHREREAREQLAWLEDFKSKFLEWVGGKPFFLCQGNHDYFSPQAFFEAEGIRAADITNRVEGYGDYWFYGFPYIPYMGYCWNWEATVQDMDRYLQPLIDFADSGVPYILVSHCPPFGTLDRTAYGEHIGNSLLATRLSFGLLKPPQAILSGHVHERGGATAPFAIKQDDGTFAYVPVYNSATTFRIVTIGGPPKTEDLSDGRVSAGAQVPSKG
jgi:Icc-related predicted phosphoesterase